FCGQVGHIFERFQAGDKFVDDYRQICPQCLTNCRQLDTKFVHKFGNAQKYGQPVCKIASKMYAEKSIEGFLLTAMNKFVSSC
ncbi:C-C motif chemokine 18, partial [Frankliniella fusca]